MAFEEVTSAAVKKMEIGDVIEGIFTGMSTGAFGENPVIKVNEDEELTLAGDTVLITKFAQVAPKSKVRVTRLEDAKGKVGGRIYHDYKVEVDK